MRRSCRLLVLAVAWALTLVALPGVSSAAPVASPLAAAVASPTAPLAAGPIDAQIWPAQGGNNTAVIIDIIVDEKVKLPVRVRIPVPKGAVVEWAGEILNGDASADQQRDFTVHDGAGGGSYAEFIMSVSHQGQIDTNGIVMTANGTVASTQVDWIQSVPSTSTVFTVRIPAGVSDVKIDPAPEGTPNTNAAGERLYLLPLQTLATGAASTVKVSYNTNPPGAATSRASAAAAVYVVLGVLLLGAFALLARLLSKQRAAGQGVDHTADSKEQEPEEDDSGARGDDQADEHDSPLPSEPEYDPFDIDPDQK